MQDSLNRIRTGLGQGAYPNERAVSTSIVVSILRQLGWDGSDPEQVLPEHTTGRGRVDYALRTPPKPVAAFIEVKGVGRSGDADRQLFECAFHEGVPLAILSDGREWSFYLPAQQGSYVDRRAYQLVLDERDPAECAVRFERYLRRDRISSGEATEAAISDYRDARSRREASATLPIAWTELLAEPDPLLVESLLERAEAVCGFRPAEGEAEHFMRALVPSDVLPRSRAIRPRPAPADTNGADMVSENVMAACSWSVGKSSGMRRNAIDAFIGYLDAAFASYPDRAAQMMAAARTEFRNNIAAELADVYPRQPERAARFHRRLQTGLYVGTNLSNTSKLQLAARIAAAAGVEFGTEVKLVLRGG